EPARTSYRCTNVGESLDLSFFHPLHPCQQTASFFRNPPRGRDCLRNRLSPRRRRQRESRRLPVLILQRRQRTAQSIEPCRPTPLRRNSSALIAPTLSSRPVSGAIHPFARTRFALQRSTHPSDP